MEKAYFKRIKNVGPGGWHCACCSPAPGKERQRYLKKLRQAEKQAFRRLLNKETE